MFKKIVVALDGSECSGQALDVALKLAKSEGAQLSVCSVVDPVMVAGTAPAAPSMDIVYRDMEADAQLLVSDAVTKAQQSGLTASGQCRSGVPAFQILSFAKEAGADAIVMGTHGRGGLKRLMMGSVAETVLRESPVPVVIVREQQPAKAHAVHT
jgi:nucleotide-binding universal stress UspA family protein